MKFKKEARRAQEKLERGDAATTKERKRKGENDDRKKDLKADSSSLESFQAMNI